MARLQVRPDGGGEFALVGPDNPLPVAIVSGGAGGGVQSINGEAPDSEGNVELSAADVGAAPASHTHTAAQVSDASTVGRSVLTAADAAAARSAVGAGTSSLGLGTTGSTAAAGNHTHGGLMSGSASAVADSEAADVAGLVADFNALLAALRTRGVIA